MGLLIEPPNFLISPLLSFFFSFFSPDDFSHRQIFLLNLICFNFRITFLISERLIFFSLSLKISDLISWEPFPHLSEDYCFYDVFFYSVHYLFAFIVCRGFCLLCQRFSPGTGDSCTSVHILRRGVRELYLETLHALLH